MEEYIISKEGDRQELFDIVDNLPVGTVVKISKPTKKRSDQQRKSIEVYCKLVATSYNDAGLDKQIVLAEQMSIPWNQKSVKEDQWRQIQLALKYDKSTTQLEPKQVNEIYEIHNRFTQSNFGFGIDFPSVESMIRGSYD